VGREPFFFNLGALGAAFLMVVAAAAFGPDAAKGVGLGIGIAGLVVSLWFLGLLVHRRRFEGYREVRVLGHRVGVVSMLAGVITSIAIWEIIGAAVFTPAVSRWLTLANGLLIALVGCAGLVTHEWSTERVVHVLEVFDRSDHDR
jgi:hypothetical protein